MNREEAKQYALELWEEHEDAFREDDVRCAEIDECCMTYGDVKMRYGISVIGPVPADGYPVYIALHGGGKDPGGRMNEQQWNHMAVYYKDSVENGIYVNPRGVRDTWDTHANPESYPLYDRLLENLAVFYGADLNRVYLMGFSAGGDGVYLVGPRMADRFAALHMSAGHPNEGSLVNLYHTPIQLQVGMNDFAYGRNQVTVEYEHYLDELQRQDPDGYLHNVYVHVDKPHNFRDNAREPQLVMTDNTVWLASGQVTRRSVDSNAVHFLEQFERNPLPQRVIWELDGRDRTGLRACESFYWLRAPKEFTEGKVIAHLCQEENSVVIEQDDTNGNLQILLRDEMLDLDWPVTIVYPDQSQKILNCTRSEQVMRETLKERGDKSYIFSCIIDARK